MSKLTNTVVGVVRCDIVGYKKNMLSHVFELKNKLGLTRCASTDDEHFLSDMISGRTMRRRMKDLSLELLLHNMVNIKSESHIERNELTLPGI